VEPSQSAETVKGLPCFILIHWTSPCTIWLQSVCAPALPPAQRLPRSHTGTGFVAHLGANLAPRAAFSLVRVAVGFVAAAFSLVCVAVTNHRAGGAPPFVFKGGDFEFAFVRRVFPFALRQMRHQHNIRSRRIPRYHNLFPIR
jgi:hypothetical protein